MKMPQKTLLLLLLFAILTFVTITTVYVTHQIPTQETETNALCTYRSTAMYDYAAILDHNVIQKNVTILGPNEGTLYTEITRQINMSLEYTFYSSLPAIITITYRLSENLKTPACERQIASIAQTITNQTRIQITPQPIIRAQLESLKEIIEIETGTSSETYAVEIMPIFTINAETTAGVIEQTFTPVLNISFERTNQGNIIAIGDLSETNSGAITENQTIIRYDILNQRYMSIALVTTSIAGLFVSSYLHKKMIQKPEKLTLEKITAPYRDLIIEATESPKAPLEPTIINVQTIKELAKTARLLAKPIILTRRPQPIFAIIDQNIEYQHKP
jgi:hypothetical protein